MVLHNFLRLDRARFVLLGCQWSTWKIFFFSQELLFGGKQVRRFGKYCIYDACYLQVIAFVSSVGFSNLLVKWVNQKW